MQRKERFPPEPDTRPDVLRAKSLTQRQSVMAPKKPGREGASSTVDRREKPTDPPPGPKRRATLRPPGVVDARASIVRARRSPGSDPPAATVDEVVADMSRDPRRERDEDD